VDRDIVPNSGELVLSQCLTTEKHALQGAVIIPERKIGVSGSRTAEVADLAFEPQIRIERIGFERFAEETNEDANRKQTRH
jgi:hypothetical protein